MRDLSTVLALVLLSILPACAPSSFFPPAEPIRFESQVEYIEVGTLTGAEENIRIPLGPGRSYWFNGSDGSRWASDLPTVPPSPGVVILQEGRGIVYTPSGVQQIRHVDGPRNVKRGWYGRAVETRPGAGDLAEVTLEDGRRFEGRVEGGDLPSRLPYEVLLGEDTTRLFLLRSGAELAIERELPAG